PEGRGLMPSACILIGAPIDSGRRREGCLMGPAAYRVAGLAQSLESLGQRVEDRGDVAPAALRPAACPNPAVHHLTETVAWTAALADELGRASWRETAQGAE